MKQPLSALIQTALTQLQQQTLIPLTLPDDITIHLEYPRNPAHGDFSCNIALLLAKRLGQAPRPLAQMIIKALPADLLVAKVEVAGPGFINFWINPTAFQQQLMDILQAREQYGRSTLGQGQRVQIEFVSANPTGPLHVGHGRGAAYGDSLANILAAAGYTVHREYYVNDAGRQMDILATSIWLRYLELCGATLRFPANGYRGDYVWDIAATLHRTHHTQLYHAPELFWSHLPEDAATPEEREAGLDPLPQGDKEAYIDALIVQAKQILGANYATVFNLGLKTILDDIRDDLGLFRIYYDEWYSERSLSMATDNRVQATIDRLKATPYWYEQDGAGWFRSTAFGDEKDRVVIRENGQMTYFAADMAYHLHKFERGFNQLINIWGADHHGYIPRVKAALQALGQDPDKLQVLLVQFATLYRQGQQVQMSTRSGEYVTLRQLRKEVGTDAARFFYVQSKCEKHMDFDLELAKSQTSANPVYAIQYAYARICSVLKKCQERGWPPDPQGAPALHLLTEPPVQALLITLSRYPDTVMAAAQQYEPHQIAHYLHELATDLHRFYDAQPPLLILTEDALLRNARLILVMAVQQVLRNGLQLLGVSAPESM